MANENNPQVKGPSDLYDLMLEVKIGLANGTKRGCTWITKRQCKEIGIEWPFVEKSVQILGLKMVKSGRSGFVISN